MGNNGPESAVDNVVGMVEESRLFAEDAASAGSYLPLVTEGGSLRTVTATPNGNKLTDALDDESTDEFRTRLLGLDDAGALQETQVEALNVAPAVGTTATVTYPSRALNDIGQDELVSRLTDATGAQIDPDEAPEYPEASTVGHDLIGAGDLTVGPLSVARSEAVVLSVNSTDANSWSVTASWQDSTGNVFQSESATDLGLDSSVDDWARLVRKGPQVSFTITDTSAATSNNVNVYADTHR